MPAIDLIYTAQNDWISTAGTTINESFWLTPSPDKADPHLISLIFKLTATVGNANPAVLGPLSNAFNRFFIKIGTDSKPVIDYLNPVQVADSAQLFTAFDMQMQHAGGSSVMQQANADGQVTFTQMVEMPLGYAFNGNSAPECQIILSTLAGGGAAGWGNTADSQIASATCEIWGRYGVAEDTICYGMLQKTPQTFSANEQLPVTVSPIDGYDMLGVVIANATGTTTNDLDSIQVRNGASTLIPINMLSYINRTWNEPYVLWNTAGTGTDSSPVLRYEVVGLDYWNLYGVQQGVPVTFNVKNQSDADSSFYFAPIFGRKLSGYGAERLPTQFQDLGQPITAAVNDANVGGSATSSKPVGNATGASSSMGGYGRRSGRRNMRVNRRNC